MKFSLIKSVRHSNDSFSEERSTNHRPIRLPLLDTLLDIVNKAQLTREERLEIDELQRSLGIKSRRETIQIARQFVDMMENGRDYDDLA